MSQGAGKQIRWRVSEEALLLLGSVSRRAGHEITPWLSHNVLPFAEMRLSGQMPVREAHHLEGAPKTKSFLWRLPSPGDKSTLERAAIEDGMKVSGWLDRYAIGLAIDEHGLFPLARVLVRAQEEECNPAELWAFLQQEAKEPSKLKTEKHLADCAACRRALLDLAIEARFKEGAT